MTDEKKRGNQGNIKDPSATYTRNKKLPTFFGQPMLNGNFQEVDPETIELSVVGKSLTLRGARQSEELKEGETYHRRERWEGSFSKTVQLPFTVESDKVNARFTRGVLTVELPRAEAEKPRKIIVKTA